MANALLRRSLLPVENACHGASSAAVERELALPAYRGAYEDYAEIAVQLALVASFAGAFPPAPLLALAESALELRVDALSLCLFRRRPVPERASGIGPWAARLRTLPVAAACVVLALLYLAADNYAAWSAVGHGGAFVASAGAGLVAADLLWLAVPPRSRTVRDVQARRAFVVNTLFGGGGGGEDGGGGGEGGAAGGGRGGESGALREAEKRALKASEAENENEGGTEDDGEEEAGEATPAHYQERPALLRRLNTALSKRDETLGPEPVETSAPPLEEEEEEEEEEEQEEEEEHVEEEEERAVVAYFVHSEASPPAPPLPPPPPLPPLSTPPPQDEPPRVAEPPPINATTATAAVDAPGDAAVEVVVVAEEETPAPEPYARTALAGMDAIHAAVERERFDFAQDAGWQEEPAPDAPVARAPRLVLAVAKPALQPLPPAPREPGRLAGGLRHRRGSDSDRCFAPTTGIEEDEEEAQEAQE